MRTPKLICEQCEQTFTRRWNANRHCNNIHHGTYCIILFSQYIANKGKNSLLKLQDKFSEDPNPIRYKKSQFFQAKANPLLEAQFKSSIDPIEDNIDGELLLYDKLDEVGPQYQQLENLLAHVPEQYRRFFLGFILTRALLSENPVAFIQNQLEGFRKAKMRNKMLDDISASIGFNKNITKEFLKMGLKKPRTH
jgi:hypothetical protein